MTAMKIRELHIRRGVVFRMICGLALILSLALIPPQPAYSTTGEQEINSAQLVFENGLFEYYKKNYLRAATLFNRAIIGHPGFQGKTEALRYHLLCLSNLNLNNEALPFLRTHSKKIAPEVYFAAVENFYHWGNYPFTLEILSLMPRKTLSPDRKDTFHYLRARSLVAMRQFSRAIKTIAGISNRDSSYYYYGTILKSRVLFMEQKAGEAVALLQTLLTAGDKNSGFIPDRTLVDKVHLLLGRIYFEQSKYAEAANYFNKINTGDYYFDALTGLHWSYFKNSEHGKAAEVLLVIKKQFPVRYYQDDLPLNLAFSWHFAGDTARADIYFGELRAHYKRKGELMSTLLRDDRMPETSSHLILKNRFGVDTGHLPAGSETENRAVEVVKSNPDLSTLPEYYLSAGRIVREAEAAQKRMNDLHLSLRKKIKLIRSFLKGYKKLKKDYAIFQKKINAAVGPLLDKTKQTPEEEDLVKKTVVQYERRFRISSTSLERKLARLKVNEDINHPPQDAAPPPSANPFDSALEMAGASHKLLARPGLKWSINYNYAIDNYKSAVSTAKKVAAARDKMQDLLGRARVLQDEIIKSASSNIKKEAFRVLAKIEFDRDEIQDAVGGNRGQGSGVGGINANLKKKIGNNKQKKLKTTN